MNTKLKTFTGAITTALFLSACGSSSDPVPTPVPPPPVPVSMAKFDITVINNTNAQPFSPVAVVAHNSNYSMFAIGSPASVAIEQIAEAGNNSSLLNDASSDANVVGQASGSGVISPGASETIELEFPESDIDLVSLVTMYENTNDAISGSTNVDLKTLAVDENLTIRGFVYDAGTERNTETSGTVPGPAVGGEAFNATRDDLSPCILA